jgi:hypothetical protein
VLAVRAMAGETSWLDGQILWHAGRVYWQSQGRLIAPTPSDLALAQRRLYQIRRYPLAAQQALGDLSTWLAQRGGRLELAKRLHPVRVSDFTALGRHPHLLDMPSVKRLTDLMVAEAVCSNTLPVSPARALAASGERAQDSVCAIIADKSLPNAARALAGLTLGDLHRQMIHAGYISSCTQSALIHDNGWTERTYAWGLRSGIPEDPTLYVKLLSDEDGASIARRYELATQVAVPFRIESSVLHELLGSGVTPKRLAAIVEALIALVPLSKLIMDYREGLPDRPAGKRRDAAEALRAERQGVVAKLRERVHSYIRATPDSIVVELVAQLAYAIVELRAAGSPLEGLLEHLLAVLDTGLSLPAPQQQSYLELLVEHREQMWDRSCQRAKTRQADWLAHCQAYHIEPVRALLNATSNVEIVREAIRLDINGILSKFEWQELDRYRCLLTLARDLDLGQESYLARRVCNAIGSYTDLSAARSDFQLILRPLMPLGTEIRRQIASALFYAIPYTRQGQRQALQGLLPFFPRLVEFASEDQRRMQVLGSLMECALRLQSTEDGRGGQGAIWLDWVLGYLAQRAQGLENDYRDLPWPIPAAAVAVALAEGNSTHFQALFRAVMEHQLEYEWERVEEGLKVINRFLGLRAIVADMLPRQPHRCVRLLEHMSVLPRLSESVHPTIASDGEMLPSEVEVADLPLDWQALLSTAPELLGDAVAYIRAQQIAGGKEDLPAGLRHTLEQPAKWVRELSYLQTLRQTYPDRSDLATREDNLRMRLADSDVLLNNSRTQLAESLQNLLSEAQLAAIEHQVTLSYQKYLERIAGPRSMEVQFSDDLLNAAQLTVGIKSNRRLLLRLLRGYLGGERRWPEQHPANVDYLQKLEARGVDVQMWLQAYPKVYSCRGVVGGRVHIQLERDPLSILQMGNHFGTCLRSGGINAFSTVANACELNKRVIYARDSKGNIIGRKLIGISTGGKLVGFHTYTTLEQDTGGNELRVLFNQYGAEFAERCGLTLADEGNVARLFAQEWYDDGVIPWKSDEQSCALTRR